MPGYRRPVTSLPRPAAVICDLDGTLVDTVPTRIVAWLRALDEFGLDTDPPRLASHPAR
jgi:beta-phosphoglucomutase-like phosphatase (HAD superfamily)